MPTPSEIMDALRAVEDPDFRRDIVSLGFVKDVQLEGAVARVVVELTTPACPVKDLLQKQCEDAILGVPGVERAEVTMSARTRSAPAAPEDLIPGVRQCIAIASGKGGVGKSTLSLNLAIALAQAGAKVGLLDADVYGPTIPAMLGAEMERPYTKDQKIIPLELHGIKAMSIGFLMEPGQSVLWRGPMVAGTVRQLLGDVLWGELDYLLVDLPPGTGDAPMSLAQLVPLTGVAIVTTPHTVSAGIAGKSAELFRRLQAPVLGVIENMGLYRCPSCGTESRLFNGMSGSDLANSLETAFLGSVPLDPEISASSDEGIPCLVAHPESVYASVIRSVAGKMAAQASLATANQGR